MLRQIVYSHEARSILEKGKLCEEENYIKLYTRSSFRPSHNCLLPHESAMYMGR